MGLPTFLTYSPLVSEVSVELTLLPRRKRRLPARGPVIVAIAVLLLGWLGVLLLVPSLFGLRTTVVSEPKDEYQVGTLMLTRSVPASDLASTDVLTVGDELRHVSHTEPGVVVVDGTDRLDTGDNPTLDRVLVTVPVAGLPLAGPANLAKWASVSAVAGFAALAIASASAALRGVGRVRLAG